MSYLRPTGLGKTDLSRRQRIGDQTSRENAFSEKSKPSARTRDLFEANLIADRFAKLFAKFVRHAASRQSRGQTARLQHQHLSGD